MEKKADFYKVAAENNVDVLFYPLPNAKSISTEVYGQCYIGMDNSRSYTCAEEQACLGHELGHCLYGGFYSKSTPFDMIERHEVRADHWYIRRAIPKDVLLGLLREGHKPWEIAEELNTTEDYVSRAYYYYMDNEISG